MGITANSLGVPGIGVAKAVAFNFVSYDGNLVYLPAGGLVKQAKGYNPFNSDNLRLITVGTLMAQHPTNFDYAPWIIGVTSGAITGGATSLTISAASAVELVRRIGSTGTFVLTAPPAASGVTRQVTVTYSAVNTSTGVVTITAIGVNQVEQIDFNAASTAGNLKLNVQIPAGTYVTTANIAWNATDATYLASINSALDTATGVVGGIVASAIPATDTDLGIRLTYSGTGYAGLAWNPAEVALFPTSSTSAIYTPITTAVNGAAIAGATVSEANYSIPVTVVGDDNPILMHASGDNDWPRIPMAGILKESKIANLPTDASFKLWVEQQMSTLVGNKFVFRP